jgi:hypothetical protein
LELVAVAARAAGALQTAMSRTVADDARATARRRGDMVGHDPGRT